MAGPKSVELIFRPEFPFNHSDNRDKSFTTNQNKAEIAEENNLPRVFEEKVCLFPDTFTYVSNCYRK